MNNITTSILSRTDPSLLKMINKLDGMLASDDSNIVFNDKATIEDSLLPEYSLEDPSGALFELDDDMAITDHANAGRRLPVDMLDVQG